MYFDSREIYQKVDRMRLDRGWSIYHLAELSNVSVNSLYSWRDRGSSPTLHLIESIANAFGVSPITLLLQGDEFVAVNNEHKELFEMLNNLSNEQKNSLMKMIYSLRGNN